MTTNSNIGATYPDTNHGRLLGTDNPGQTTCGNCRKSVTPVPTSGIRQYAEATGNPNDGLGNVGFGTGGGYHCPSCGHNLTWVKSTGKAGGPSLVDNTNQPSAADM